MIPKGVRVAKNGTMWHPRPTKSLLEFMDNHFERIDNNSWRPKGNATSYKDAGIKIKSKAYIIGKGPTLDKVVSGEIKLDPSYSIVTVNDACNPLAKAGFKIDFTVVADAGPIYIDPTVTVICSTQAQSCHADPYIFSSRELGLPTNMIGGGVAITLASYYGAKECVGVAFDAVQSGNITYAKSLGHDPINSTESYRNHGPMLEKSAKQAKIKFSYLDLSSSYTQQQLSLHPQEHYEHEDSQPYTDSQPKKAFS